MIQHLLIHLVLIFLMIVAYEVIRSPLLAKIDKLKHKLKRISTALMEFVSRLKEIVSK